MPAIGSREVSVVTTEAEISKKAEEPSFASLLIDEGTLNIVIQSLLKRWLNTRKASCYSMILHSPTHWPHFQSIAFADGSS